MGFRELVDFDQLGVQYSYVGISALKVNVKKSPDLTLRFVRTMIDGIQVFKSHKEKSMAVMKRYLRGASDDMLDENLQLFRRAYAAPAVSIRRSGKDRPRHDVGSVSAGEQR
jgi:hypothetical protein